MPVTNKDADDAHRDGTAAGVLGLLAQRGRRLEAGEGGKAVDHRIREVGEPLVGDDALESTAAE